MVGIGLVFFVFMGKFKTTTTVAPPRMADPLSGISGGSERSLIVESEGWLAKGGISDIEQLREVTGPMRDQLQELFGRRDVPQRVEAVLTHAIGVWERRLSSARKIEGRKAVLGRVQMALLVLFAGAAMGPWDFPIVLNYLTQACGVVGIVLCAVNVFTPKDDYAPRLSRMIHAAKAQRGHLGPRTTPAEATEIARRVHTLYDALQPNNKEL